MLITVALALVATVASPILAAWTGCTIEYRVSFPQRGWKWAMRESGKYLWHGV